MKFVNMYYGCNEPSKSWGLQSFTKLQKYIIVITMGTYGEINLQTFRTSCGMEDPLKDDV